MWMCGERGSCVGGALPLPEAGEAGGWAALHKPPTSPLPACLLGSSVFRPFHRGCRTAGRQKSMLPATLRVLPTCPCL